MYEKETAFFHKRVAQRAKTLGLTLKRTDSKGNVCYTTEENPNVVLDGAIHYKCPGVIVQLYVRQSDIKKKFFGGVFYITDIKEALDCFFDNTLEK